MAEKTTTQPAAECFKAIFDSSDFCFAVINEDGRILEANTGMAHLLGCRAPAALAGMLFAKLIAVPADAKEPIAEAALNCFFKEAVFAWRGRLRRHDGTTVGANLVSRRDAGSGRVLVEAMPLESAAEETALAASETDSFLENIFSTVGDGLYVTDELGHIVKANPAFAAMLGYRPDEIMGRHFVEFSMHPDADSGAAPRLMQELLNRGAIENYETRWRRKDGTPVQVELNVTLLKNVRGAMIGAVSAARDVSGRKKIEAGLLESEQRFRVLANSAPDAIIFLDCRGRIIFWNQGAQKIYGYDYREMLGKTPDVIMPPHALQSHAAFFSSDGTSRPDLGTLTFDSVGLRKNGEQFPLEISLSSGRAGNDLFYCAVARDATERKRAEAELKQTRDFLQDVFLSTGDGILITDTAGNIVRVNAAAERMLGAPEHNLLGRHAAELVPAGMKDEPYLERVGAMRKSLFATGRIEHFESAWLGVDGNIFPIEITTTLLNDANGRFSGTISCVRDITERKKTEQALRDSEARFRELAESLPEGIIAIDEKGHIVFWNTGAKNLFGYTRDEVLGRPSIMLVPERCRRAEQEGLRALQLQGGAEFRGRVLHGVGRRRDGTEFADEISSGTWQTSQGRYYVAVIRDITERLEAEQALRESEQRFKELADALPQTVFELDRDGIITFVNRTALETFGHSQADIDKGLHALHMIVPEHRLTVSKNLEKVLAGERLGGQEYLALRKDGTTFPCIIHAGPIMADGAPQGLRGLLVDMTLRKELEEEMNKSKRLASIATLAGGVAQDFNTILSIILGNLNLAQHQIAPEDRAAEHLAAAERATLRAKDLTAQLIAFARGGTALKTVVSVENLLHEAAGAALKGSNTTCAFDFPQDLQPARLDEAQMRQVFINLLINADHAMPEGGSIDVAAKNVGVGPGHNLPLDNGEYIKITISDQSIGILNEHLQQLFDPYFTSRQRGSGIGLATTYTIIKNHGGLITVESEFGRGTTFHIFLPAATDTK